MNINIVGENEAEAVRNTAYLRGLVNMFHSSGIFTKVLSYTRCLGCHVTMFFVNNYRHALAIAKGSVGKLVCLVL